MKLSASAGFGLFLLLQLTPQTAAVAQIEIQARLGAQIGMVTPQSTLYKWENRWAGGWDVTRSQTDLGLFPVIGLSLDVGDPDLGFWLKARVHRSIGLAADFNGLGFDLCEGACFDEVVRSVHLQWGLDSEITEFGLDLALPTRIGFRGVEPFVVAGLGIRHYSFDQTPHVFWELGIPLASRVLFSK